MPSTSPTLGRVLLADRAATRSTQTELGEVLGFTRPYVSRLERDERTVSDAATLRRIAIRLGVPARLLGVSDPDRDPPVSLELARPALRLAWLAIALIVGGIEPDQACRRVICAAHLRCKRVGAHAWAAAMTASMTPIATALLVRDGRALLVHRRPSRLAYPDSWGLAGGHVEPGELPSQTVSRECLEELGTQICRPRHIPMTVADPDLEMHGFLVTRWTAEPFNAAPEEHDDIRWFLPSELATLTLAHPECLPDILNAIQFATDDGMPDKPRC